MKSALGAFTGLALLVTAGHLDAGEQKIPLREVPEPVLDAVKAKYPNAELKGATRETSANKRVTYEISAINQGKKITVSLGQEGKIEEIETEIAIADLPRIVTDALAAKYPKATLKKAEEIVDLDDGKEEKEYEVEVVTAEGKSIEVTIAANGKIDDD